MARETFFFFDPDRNFRIGILVLSAGAILSIISALFLIYGSISPDLSLEHKKQTPLSSPTLSFSLDIEQGLIALAPPRIEEEISFSAIKSHPTHTSPSQLLIKLKKTGQEKQVALPAKIDLKYDNGLQFASDASPFWITIHPLDTHKISVDIFTSSETPIKTFVAQVEEKTIQAPLDLAKDSPFRLFADIRFVGKDLFLENYSDAASQQRAEIGLPPKLQKLFLKEGDFLAFQEGKWEKIEALPIELGAPLARISSFDDKTIVFDGWDAATHIRFALPIIAPMPLKTKGEELFTAVRFRSEKQMSCMMEKQCLVLKTGDWVFKGENRWKILRKKEEKEAYLSGKWMGELFVFDRIETKAGQKIAQGHLFNANHSLMVPVEVSAARQGKRK